MNNSIMNTYNRYPVSFVNGKGSWLKSGNGEDYLDFAAGIAVNILGHNHPELNKAMMNSVDKIWHLSNLYEIPEQEELAKKLCSLSFAEKVFFCNSGAEAVEGAIKVARKYFYSKGETSRNEIITFSGSFHGRTLATLKLNNKYKPLEKISILDIGCGGGLLSEPMSRLGANVVGIDASQKNIDFKFSIISSNISPCINSSSLCNVKFIL